MNVLFQTKIALLLSNLLVCQRVRHRIAYDWVYVDYEYPSEEARNEAMRDGNFIPSNIFINDVDYYAPTNRYFVAAPLFLEGNPASLAEVIPTSGRQGILRPFPDWIKNETDSLCFNPLSVFRVSIDKCGLMWVIDSGRSDVMFGGTLSCPPKLSIYDLNQEDRLILRYEFPSDVITDRSYIVNIITESYSSDCSDSIAYIADCNDHGLIVFDYVNQTSWRFDNKLFYPYPTLFDMNISGVFNYVTDGIFGLALGPQTDPIRKLYFHSFAGLVESWVPLNVLKNQTAARDRDVARTEFSVSPGQREGQSMVQVMTDDGILIYSLIPQNAIACWNSKTSFTLENQHILERDDEDFQYTSGLKLKDNKLYISSSQLQNYVAGLRNNTDIKYRVMVVDDVKQWLSDSPCSSASSASVRGDNIGGELVGSDSGNLSSSNRPKDGVSTNAASNNVGLSGRSSNRPKDGVSTNAASNNVGSSGRSSNRPKDGVSTNAASNNVGSSGRSLNRPKDGVSTNAASNNVGSSGNFFNIFHGGKSNIGGVNGAVEKEGGREYFPPGPHFLREPGFMEKLYHKHSYWRLRRD